MPRKYTKRSQPSSGSNQGDAFAAILRPVVGDLVREVITDFARSWLTQNAPEKEEEVETAAPEMPVVRTIPDPIAASESPQKKPTNGKREGNGHTKTDAAVTAE